MTGVNDDGGAADGHRGVGGVGSSEDERRHTVITTTPADVPDSGTSEYAAALAARSRRKRVAGTLLGVIVVGAVIGGVVALDANENQSSEPNASPSVATTAAPVPTRPPGIGLPAQLVFGELQPLNATAAGTVSSISEVGTVLERGDAVGLVNAVPVILFYGSEPFAREMRVGDSGTDVRQLEANLAALGFDDSGAMSVDLDYTGATAAAVAAWENSIGLARSGVVAAGRLTTAAGPVRVGEAVEPGTEVAAGQPLSRAILIRRIDDLVQDGTGVLTAPSAPGTAIRHGDTLHNLGDFPVLAITESNDFVSSVRGPLAAGDIEGVEAALVFFGYDPDRVIVIDTIADLATLAAFARWQTAVGLPETLALGPEFYIDAPPRSSICRTHVIEGQTIENGALTYSVESPTAIVEAHVPVEQAERFSIGEVIMVEVADGVVAGAVVVRSGADAVDPFYANIPAAGSDEVDDPSEVPVALLLLDAPATALGGEVTLLPEAEEPQPSAEQASADDPASCSVTAR
ncbi:MAG: hypothetical protein QNM02_19345 [Acidimicrobiia bacterium]|nr:hypothetical protein [Acidimicrobiia bacterium]